MNNIPSAYDAGHKCLAILAGAGAAFLLEGGTAHMPSPGAHALFEMATNSTIFGSPLGQILASSAEQRKNDIAMVFLDKTRELF